MEGLWPPVLLFSLIGTMIVMSVVTLFQFQLAGVWAVITSFIVLLFLFLLDHVWGSHGRSEVMQVWILMSGVVIFYTMNGLYFGDLGMQAVLWGLAAGIPIVAFFLIAGIKGRGDG